MLQSKMARFRQTGMSMALVAMLFQAAVAGISAAAASADPGTAVPGATGFIEICTRHGLMRVPVKAPPGTKAPAKSNFSCDCTLCPVLGIGLAAPAEIAHLWAPLVAYAVRLIPADAAIGRSVQSGPPPSRAPPFII